MDEHEKRAKIEKTARIRIVLLIFQVWVSYHSSSRNRYKYWVFYGLSMIIESGDTKDKL